jgi:uncharacterized protein YggE
MAGASVTARGEAVVPGRPDEGIWVIEISSLDAAPDAAIAEVGMRSTALDDLLDELEIPKAKRSTTGVTVQEEFDYTEGKQVHRGYRAQNLVTVRLEQATVAGRLIQESITRAKANVRGPTWWIAPDNPARVEACRRAAAEARRKAEAYASALGLRLGPVMEVREPSTLGEFPRPGTMRAMTASSTIEVDPGELDVGAQVEVSFRLED